MFWPFVAVASIAVGLIQLGAMSVWVAIFKAVLAFVFAAVCAVGLLFVWRRYKSKNGGD
jgi:hypothetical protein